MARASSIRVGGFLSRRSITRSNRAVTMLTVAMMAVIYAELLFVPSLIQGATDRIFNELRGTLTANVTVSPTGSQLTIAAPNRLLATIRHQPGVVGATGTILVGSQVSFQNKVKAFPVLAIDPTSYAKTFTTPSSMIAGSFIGPAASNQIVLGIGIAGDGRAQSPTYGASLQNVHVGDRVSVTLTSGVTHDFVVRGIYDTTFAEGNTTAFISSATAARLVPRLTGQVSSIYVKTDHVGGERALIDRLTTFDHAVRYRAWQTYEANVRDLTGSFDQIKSILNGVSLAVAAIAVFIVTYIDLVNRRRTIGIERAIGISGPAITISYVIKAIVFGALGVIGGAAIFFGVAIPWVRHHPFMFSIGPVTLSPTSGELRNDAVILIVVASVGALIPAWRTVHTRLLDAIGS